MSIALSNPGSAARSDVAVISLVGLAHGTSHFFHLLLPPLFPAFIRDFGVSYSQLGLLVSLFFVISAVGQGVSGFLVDRVGARPVLFAAMGCFVAAALAAAGAQGYGGLMLRPRWPAWAIRPSIRPTSPSSTSACPRPAWGMPSRCTASAATWGGRWRRWC